jgi:ABC-type Fe3+/spermidine/putrescine transport system ATPase subunit
VCQIDTPQGLYDAPADTDVAGFVGEANLFPGVFLDGSVRTVLGDLAVHCRAGIRRTGADAVVLIRPEQIKLGPAAPAAAGAGRILDLEDHGHDSVVRVTADRADGPRVILARISGQVPFAVGSQVAVSVEGPVLAWCVDAEGSSRN